MACDNGRQCQLACASRCQVNASSLRAASQLAPGDLPPEARDILFSLDHSEILKAAARATFGRLQARAQALAAQKAAARAQAGATPRAVDIVCAHWRVGDWSFPLSPEMLVSSVRAAAEVYLGVSDREEEPEGAHGRAWAVILASDAAEHEREAIAHELPVIPQSADDAPWRRPTSVAAGEAHSESRWVLGLREVSALSSLFHALPPLPSCSLAPCLWVSISCCLCVTGRACSRVPPPPYARSRMQYAPGGFECG